MAQNENISLSLANKIDILNKTQSVDARYGVYDSESDALTAMSSYGLNGRQVAVYTDKPNGKVQLFLYNQVLHQLEPVTGFTEAPAQPSKYEIISEAPVLAGIETGTETDGYVLIAASPTNLLSFTYDGGEPFEYDSYIQLDTTIDLELHKRYDVVCLTPTGGIELIEGISIDVMGVQVPSILPIPPNYFPYAYVLWDGTANTILSNQVTKVSQLLNDVGFVTLSQLIGLLTADNISYDNTAFGLFAETVQEAVDELTSISRQLFEKKEDRVSVVLIEANTKLSSVHHGKILLVTAEVTITFPRDLGVGFTGCAFRIATGGKMTPAFASGVTGNDFFVEYNPGESLYVFKESDGTNVFYAV